jgi:DUF1680 family protein
MSPTDPDRRRFLGGSTTLALGLLASGAREGRAAVEGPGPAPGLTDTSSSPHVRVRSVGLGEARWSRGFWADRFDTCSRATLPHLWKMMSGTEPSQFYQNLRIAAGEADGNHRGPGWNDGDFYKWIEAASATYAITKDADLARLLDEVIRVIVHAQDADGYLHSPVQIRRRHGDPDAAPFRDRLDFETYNLGHLITAACVHHRATGKSTLLDPASKAAKFLAEAVRMRADRLARIAVCPSHYMAVVELYRTTRDPAHLELARRLLDLRDRVEDGSDDNQDRIPFRRQSTAAGHAVRANYLYAGAADLVAETGDRTLMEPLLKIWDDVVSRKLYLTGGCGALYDGASPDGSKDQKTITRVHQAFGRPYQLPNSTAHNETCAAIGNVLWNWRMLMLTGEAKFADILEQSLYNAVLAGIGLDGTRFFYTNTLRQLDEMPTDLRWSRQRQPFISCFCCPPNLARTIAETSSYAYGRSAGAAWVHLYGDSILDTEVAPGSRLRLRQETDYPWGGRVTIRIEDAPRPEFSLRLRIPGWADGALMTVNGRPWLQALPLVPASYADLHRTWSPGDVVELTLPMRVRCIQAHPLVEEARNQVAFQRGPIVYCLESTDLPGDVRVLDVAVPRKFDLTPRFDPALLGGLAVLEGRAEATRERPWSGGLYRERRVDDSRAINLRLIPYYAWANRGRSEMTVWLPLGS